MLKGTVRVKDFLEWANGAKPEAAVVITSTDDGTTRLSAVSRCGKKRTVIEIRRSILQHNDVV